jgi:hypothetical protein
VSEAGEYRRDSLRRQRNQRLKRKVPAATPAARQFKVRYDGAGHLLAELKQIDVRILGRASLAGSQFVESGCAFLVRTFFIIRPINLDYEQTR